MYKVRSTERFTLIEHMMVVTMVAFLAAIAIPAYLDYGKKAKLSETLNAIDAVAQSVCEYHAGFGVFPTPAYAVNNLAGFRQQYVTITLENGTAADGLMNIVATFTASLDLTAAAGTEGELRLNLNYDAAQGYLKTWDSGSSIDGKYVPRQ